MLKKLLTALIVTLFLISMSAFVNSYAREKPFDFKFPFIQIWRILFQHEKRIADLEEMSRVAGLKVYDADGQFLGFATDLDYIYNPSLKRFLRIDLSDGDLRGATLFFESPDCSGKPYSFPEMSYSYLENFNKYYAGKKVEPISIHVKSQWGYTTQYCLEVTWGEVYYYLVPVKEINPPIKLPVALPLSYGIK
jgi:hypothetical protein